MSKEITIFQKKISSIISEAKSVSIFSLADMVVATEVLSKLNKFNDKIVAEREKVTKPLMEALKAERARWKPIEDQNNEAIEIVREKMSAYQTAQNKARDEEMDKLGARVGTGKGKLKVETAVRKMDDIKGPEDTVVTGAGVVKFKDIKIVVIDDVGGIPDEFWDLNEGRVRTALMAGNKVPGARLETKSVPVNYR